MGTNLRKPTTEYTDAEYDMLHATNQVRVRPRVECWGFGLGGRAMPRHTRSVGIGIGVRVRVRVRVRGLG